jgi:hypothetical protein
MPRQPRRTETIRFMGSRPSDEQIAQRAADFLGQYGWDVTKIGPLAVARTRRGGTAFDVRVSYVKRPSASAS